MTEKEKKPKIVFEAGITCPHCEKKLVVRKIKKLLEPAIPADYEEKIIIEKDEQKTIKESTEKKDDNTKADKKKDK